MDITKEYNKTEHLGDIITILNDGEPVGRLRQIGKHHPDVRLEWLTYHAVQVPCCGLTDITQKYVENLYNKYLANPKLNV